MSEATIVTPAPAAPTDPAEAAAPPGDRPERRADHAFTSSAVAPPVINCAVW